MSSANSYLSSTAYHASNARYASSSSTAPSTTSFNIRSANAQQPLNDLNSTRSSTSSCSTSHCLSNQCLECTTILSTRPVPSRCHLNNYTDSSSNGPHFVQNCSYLSTSTSDHHHSSLSPTDDQSASRILSMNIPVDNSNNQNSNDNPVNTSSLNIEIEEDEDDEEEDEDDILDHHTDLFRENSDQNEQLEVFVGFYRPGEYQRENVEDDDDDLSERSERTDEQKKEEQSVRQLISDDDEGNEDQDFIDEDFGPNQDEENEQVLPSTSNPADFSEENEIINEEQFLLINANLLEHDQIHHEQYEAVPAGGLPLAHVQIDEDEDQGIGAQFNDDCASSDDENNHLSNQSLNLSDSDLIYSKKIRHQRSQSDSQLSRRTATLFLSLPSLTMHWRNSFEKVEHIIIDDQQPITTMSNLLIKKKFNEETDHRSSEKRKLRKESSEEILEVLHQETSSTFTVDDAVRNVERHAMLWPDDQARQLDGHSSIEQLVQFFQLDINLNEYQHPRTSSIRKELLMDYLQYRSEADVSAADLHENLLQYPEFSSRIHCRFFPFWPPRDVDLLQWLSHWIKQNALPVAIMNMDHGHLSRFPSPFASSWQHRIIYGIGPRGISLLNPIQIQSPQQLYEQLTVDSITYIARQEIVQRYNQSPMPLTPLGNVQNPSRLFADTRWRTMNVLGQVINVLREDRQSDENETRNIPYRPTVTHVRIPSTCSSGILIFSKDFYQLMNAIDLPLRQ